MIYVIGSMKSSRVPQVAAYLRDELGYEVFDDWYASGRDADRQWQEYEEQRGRSYAEAIDGEHAWNVFNFDKRHLDEAEAVVMVIPCGKSAYGEMGYCAGRGIPVIAYITEEPKEWDIMLRFATVVVDNLADLEAELAGAVEGDDE